MIEVSLDPNRRASCSALMIIRDSERTVWPCVNSLILANCFDRFIVVMDTRTKDRTPQILAYLKEVNPKFVVSWYKWISDRFDVARNQTLKYVDTEYAFWMDSDDILLDPVGLRSLVADPRGCSYFFNILVPTPWGGMQGTRHLRLFPVLPGVEWELPVHEQLAFALRDRGVPEIPTPYRILHLGYSSEDVVTKKHKRYYGIMKRYLMAHPEESPQTRYIRQQAAVSHSYLSSRGLLGV